MDKEKHIQLSVNIVKINYSRDSSTKSSKRNLANFFEKLPWIIEIVLSLIFQYVYDISAINLILLSLSSHQYHKFAVYSDIFSFNYRFFRETFHYDFSTNLINGLNDLWTAHSVSVQWQVSDFFFFQIKCSLISYKEKSQWFELIYKQSLIQYSWSICRFQYRKMRKAITH